MPLSVLCPGRKGTTYVDWDRMTSRRRDRKDARTVIILAVALALLVGVAVAGLAVVQDNGRDDVGERFAQRAEFLGGFANAAIATSVGGVQRALSPAYAGDGRLSSAELEGFRKEWEDRYAAEFDARGRFVRVDPPSARRLALANAGSSHVRAAARGIPALSDVVVDDGVATIAFATPLDTKAGRRIIVDVAEIVGFDTLFNGVLRAAPGVEHGRGLLVDSAGVVLAGSANEPLNRRLADTALRTRILAAGRRSSFELDGVRWQVTHPAGLSGYVAVGAPLSELYAPVDGATRVLPWLYLLGLTVAAAALVTLVRRVLRSRAEVRRASLAKTEFLASASHELRTPLNGIIGFSQLLRDGKLGEISDVQAEALDDVLSSSGHLLGLIGGLLDVTRAEAGYLEFAPEPVVLDEVLGDVRTGLAALADAKRITVTTAVDADLPPTLLLDPMRLRQVLFNFLSNALKHTPEGGAVTIGAEVVRRTVRLTVSDNGPGVDPAKEAELFTRYAKLDDTTEGTGLGLAVTRQIVEAQGGQVGCSSVPGQGATFYADLPLVPVVLDELPVG